MSEWRGVKWEYRVLSRHVNLDYIGNDGWELVTIDKDGRAYFKRPVVEEYETIAEEWARLSAVLKAESEE